MPSPEETNPVTPTQSSSPTESPNPTQPTTPGEAAVTETQTRPIHPLALTPALEALASEHAAIAERDFATINVDVGVAASVAIGATPKIRVHRDEIAARFGEGAARLVDRIELVAQGAHDAHAAFSALRVPGALEAMSKEVSAEKAILLTEARCLVDARHMPSSLLAGLEGGQSYRGLVFDVTQLVVAFRHSRDAIAGKTPVTMADVDRAEDKANRFATAVAIRDGEASADLLGSSALRARAFTHLAQSYHQIRRHLGFLRWHEGDVDEIAPSLWTGRGRKRASDVAPVVPTPTTPIAPGLPGSSPFMTTT